MQSGPKHPEYVIRTSFPRRLWSASWKLVLFVGLFLALYIPFVLPFLLFPDTEYETLSSAAARMGVEFFAMATVVLAALAMTRYADRRPLRTVGLNLQSLPVHLPAGTLVGAGLVVLVLGSLAVLGNVRGGVGPGPDKDLIWSTLALLFNTVHQEVLVHGYAQQMVREKFGAAASVIVSSILLVVLHWTLFQVESLLLLTNLFAAGVLLGIAFLLSRNLWLPIGIHFGWNYLQGPILGLPVTGVDLWNSDLFFVTGSDFLTGGAFGIEGGIVASVVFVAVASIQWRIWLKRVNGNPVLDRTLP